MPVPSQQRSKKPDSPQRRVPLTAKVVRGLAAMKAACGAAPAQVLLGQDEARNPEDRQTMADYEAAVLWIDDQQRRRAETGGGK